MLCEGLQYFDQKEEKAAARETWRLEINLEDLNFFEQIQHLEIKVNIVC